MVMMVMIVVMMVMVVMGVIAVVKNDGMFHSANSTMWLVSRFLFSVLWVCQP